MVIYTSTSKVARPNSNVPFIPIHHEDEYSVWAFPGLDPDWALSKNEGVNSEQGGVGRPTRLQ